MAARLRKIAAIIVLLTGAAHGLGHFKSHRDPDPEVLPLLDFLSGQRFEMLGMKRTMMDIFDGFSLTFTLCALLLFSMMWTAERPGIDAGTARQLRFIGLGALSVWLLLSLQLMPPPVLFLAPGLLLYGAGVFGQRTAAAN